MAAIKAALGPTREEFYGEVEDWALGYPGNDTEYVGKVWESLCDSSLGWSWLDKASGLGLQAQEIFTEHPDGVVEGANMPPAPEGIAYRNAFEHMLATTIYCRNIDRFGDTVTGDLLNAKAFCVRHRGVAKVGLRSINSTDNSFLNHARAQIVAAVTYRPGQGRICQEEVNGTRRDAFNMWRASSLKPAFGVVTDADVAPWLEHIEKIFGPPGALARERFLDWCAFQVQNPGIKINWAPLLVGAEGVGKDTAIEPLRRALGLHNVATIDAEAIFEPFNSSFLPKQLLILNEAHSFRTQEKMNKLKPLIAAPPHTLTVNQKFVPQYETPNIVNAVLMSNHEDALAPTQGDRRYWVHRCSIEEKPSSAYFKAFYAWLDAGGDAKLFGWPLARDISKFDHLEPPPMTAAKQEMIDLTQPAPLRWCRELFHEGGRFEDRTIITVNEIMGAAHARNAPRDVNHKWIAQALTAEGFHTDDQLRVRVRIGGEKLRLWIRDPSGLLAQLSLDALKERYRAEAGSFASWVFGWPV
jgi:Family of unknown function (DUF5906)